MPNLHPLSDLLLTTFDLWLQALNFLSLSLRPPGARAAQNLFLRKPWARYLELRLARRFAWREALTLLVAPRTRWGSEPIVDRATRTLTVVSVFSSAHCLISLRSEEYNPVRAYLALGTRWWWPVAPWFQQIQAHSLWR